MVLESCNSLENNLLEFYSHECNFAKLKSLMSDKNLQPRLIDFYVTQYCKHTTEFFVKNEIIYDVYNSYKLQLKGYHKKKFSLFEKKKNLTIKCGTLSIILPLAKLNVYKWLINNKIIDMLHDKHNIVQKKYYDFRKESVSKTKLKKKKKNSSSLIYGINNMMKKKNVIKDI